MLRRTLVLLEILLGIALLFAHSPTDKHFSTRYNFKGYPHESLYNINNISGWIYWDGGSGINPIGNAGIIYPRFTAGVVFQDGIIWGGYIHDGNYPTLRVGGQTYNIGTVPGRIISIGVPQNPNDPDVRIYRIRRDWQTVPDSVLRLEAAELYMIPPSQVSQGQINLMRLQYETDWNEWPVQYGAPYYDNNGNGIYDPGIDEPGIADADQVIWFVCNDLDPTATTQLYGSPPIGLELQVTIWAYHSAFPTLNQMVFRRYRLINKSGFPIDSMFIAQWVDPDVGDYSNDFVGCDSTLDLGYSYNGGAFDADYNAYGLPPAAVGYVLWQGPIVPSPGDTAFFNFQPRLNYKNLPMTSFGYFISGGTISDPILGNYTGTLQWYNLLNGYLPTPDTLNPAPYVHQAGPYQGHMTRFPLNGNPITGAGDVDGQGNNYPPGDRRMVLSSGPFNMAPGDTQEIIVTVIGGIDSLGDYITSLSKVWTYAQQIHPLLGQPLAFPIPQYWVFSQADSSTLKVQVNLQPFSSVSNCYLEFSPTFGNEPPFTFPLYDDGLHYDSLANDGIWGNQPQILNRQYAVRGDLFFQSNGESKYFPAIVPSVTLRPAPDFIDWNVTWENGLQDGQINPGEKVHLSFSVHNRDQINSISSFSFQDEFHSFSLPVNIPPNGIVQNDSFFVIQVAPTQGDSLYLSMKFTFDLTRSVFHRTFPLASWTPPSNWGDTLWVQPVQGTTLNVIPIVADPTAITGHTYLVTFRVDPSSQQLYWNLIDENTGETKLANQLPGHSVEEDFPIVDGVEWNVIDPGPGLQAIVEVANRLGPLDPSDWDVTGAPFHGNNVWHSLSAPSDLNRFYLSAGGGDGSIDRILRSIENAQNHDFEIRFTNNGGIFLWWYDDDSWTQIPFEAWDVGIATYEDTTDDVRCLTGGYSGGGTTGIFDYTYTDPALGYPATDWLYIRKPLDSLGTYQAFYNDVTSGAFTYDWWSHSNEVLARIIFCDYTGNQTLPETGTVIRFITNKINYDGDTVKVITDSTLSNGLQQAPLRFYLAQNYPNPFNPLTTIQFSIAMHTKVKLEIFNVLGQKVRTLVDDKLAPGVYQIKWKGQNDEGIPLGSGVYFYRLKAGKFVKVRKMILLK